MPKAVFFGIFSCMVTVSLKSAVWCMTMFWGNYQSLLFQIFILFLSLFHLVLPLCICYNFCSCLKSLDSLFFQSFAFQFWTKFSVDISQLSNFFCVQSTNKPSKAFFTSVTMFLIPVLFQVLLRISVSVLICPCYLACYLLYLKYSSIYYSQLL